MFNFETSASHSVGVPEPAYFLQASHKTSIGASKMIFSRRDVENLDSEIAGVEKNLDPGPGVAKVLFPGLFFPRGASQGGRRAGLEEEALRV